MDTSSKQLSGYQKHTKLQANGVQSTNSDGTIGSQVCNSSRGDVGRLDQGKRKKERKTESAMFALFKRGTWT